MKKLFISMLAVAALASCSQEDVIVADKGDLIGFNSFVENSTRADKATDPSYKAATLDHFNVYGAVGGVNIYAGNRVTRGDEADLGDAWSMAADAPTQYWIADAQYNFAAVVDVDEDSNNLPDGVTVDENGMPETIVYNTENQNDLLYAEATATGKASGNDKVNFTFAHLLSKAQFTVKSNTADGYFHNVTNIKVKNFETGTYTVGAATPWSTASAPTDAWISFGDITGVEATDTDGVTNTTQKLLLPTTTDFVVTFTVEIWNGTTKLGTQDYTKTVSQDLAAGNTYNFNLNLSVGELIQFTVTTNPTWANGSDTTLTL